MKEYHAKLSFLRRSPRKVQRIARLIQGKQVQEAIKILTFSPHAVALPLKKLMYSALANGGHDANDVPANVFVKEIVVNQGPTIKRWMPRAQGRASPINKRTSHVFLKLKEKLF